MKIIIVITLYVFLNHSNTYSQPGWFYQNPYPTGEYLYTIKYFSNNTCIAAGSTNTILKTTNNGVLDSILRFQMQS